MEKFYDIGVCDIDKNDSARVIDACKTFDEAYYKFNNIIRNHKDDYSYVEIREITTEGDNVVSVDVVKTWWFDAEED